MSSDLRVVVDTNVLISGLLGIRNSPSSRILNAIRAQKIILVSSPLIIQEIGEVINRKRIIKLTKMNPKERIDFIGKLIERSDITEGKQLSEIVGRDIQDDKFLACGIEGKADYIITGDRDLLVLKKYQGLKIVTPREFIDILNKKD